MLGPCASLAVLGLLACGAATAYVEPEVRVLLYDGEAPIRVGDVETPAEIAPLPDGGLRVAGRAGPDRWQPAGDGPWRVGSRTVRGRILVRNEAGRVQVLNRIALEDYVASTVGGEMSPSWPAQALRAQAVAARTYVLYEARRRRAQRWDVLATASSQVYRGIDAETRETREATRATEGQVLTWEGQPILAVFHSTAGGRTATAGEVWGEDRPYLQVVEVEDEDDAPHTYWRAEFAPETLEGVLEGAAVRVGRLEALEIGGRTASGRVERLRVSGSSGRERLAGKRLRRLFGELGLRSTLFEIRRTDTGYAFVGSGHGHGVGMSQWGARAMARKGASYRRILARFYPGARLETWPSRRAGLGGAR